MPARGHQVQLLMAFESTYKDETDRNMTKIPVDGSGPQLDMMKDLLANPEMRAVMSQAAPVPGNKTVSGSFRPTFHFATIGHMLRAAIGSVSSKTAGTIDAPVEEAVAGATTLARSGAYTGTNKARYEIICDAEGSPDTFKWRRVDINHFGTETNGAWTNGVAVTGAAQLLERGVSVTFSATDTMTLNDEWSIAVWGQNRHLFTRPTAAGLPWFQLEEGYVDIGEYTRANGCIMSRLVLPFSGQRPGVLIPEATVVGADYETITAATQALAVTSPSDTASALHHFGGIYIDGSQTTEKIEEITITIDNGQEGLYEIQNASDIGTLGVNQEGDPAVTVDMVMAYNDKTLREIAQAETEKAIMVAVVSGNYWLMVKLPEVQLQDVKQKPNSRGIIRHTIPGRAHYTNSTEASDIYVELFGGPASIA